MNYKDRRILIGIIGIILITLLLYPSSTEDKEISVGLYFIYHYEEDLLPNWYEDASKATKIAGERLNSHALTDDYYFTFNVGDVYQVNNVVFGNGSAIPEFDGNKTMNLILQDLISYSDFLEIEDKNNITILVFPLSKCISRQYTIVSAKGSTPIFLSYNALLAETHFERYILEHEIFHTFGLPDRDCSAGKNCEYPDDIISVMARTPMRFYLSRSDYLDFRIDRINPIDLVTVSNRNGSERLPRPYINEDGSCPTNVKSTREWRLIYGG